MAVSNAMDKPGDDAKYDVSTKGYELGLLSDLDPLDIPINGLIDCENILLGEQGKAIGRNGWNVNNQVVATENDPDGIAEFTDPGNTIRNCVWIDGDLYDTSVIPATVIESGCYAAGRRIAWTVLNGVLHWSDGDTIFDDGFGGYTGQRYWDGSSAGPIVTTGAPGSIEPPAAGVMTTYAGSVVIGNTKLTDGTLEPHLMRWSDVNDGSTYLGVNAQVVALGLGGFINAIVPFTVATEGINLARTIFVGKSTEGVFGLQGALGTMEENILNAKVGVLDGATAKLVKGPDSKSGVIFFLGTDGKPYWTNGVSIDELAADRCSKEIEAYVTNRLQHDPAAKFTALRMERKSLYVLDLGGDRQYAYNFVKGNWTKFRGWPSGYWVEARDGNRRQVLYGAHTRVIPVGGDLDDLEKWCFMSQVDVTLEDNGVAIEPYLLTGHWSGDVGESGQNAGDRAKDKLWHTAYVDVTSDTSEFRLQTVTQQGHGDRSDDTFQVTSDVVDGNAATYGSAIYGASYYGSGGSARYPNWTEEIRIVKDNSALNLPPSNIRGGCIQAKISQPATSKGKYWQVNGHTLKYLPRGLKRGVR